MQVQDASRLQGAWIDESTGLRGYALARVRRAVKNHQSRQYIAEVCLEPEDDIDRYLAAVEAPVPSDNRQAASSSPPRLGPGAMEQALQRESPPARTTRGETAAPSQSLAERMREKLVREARVTGEAQDGGPVTARTAPRQSLAQRMRERLVRQGRLPAE